MAVELRPGTDDEVRFLERILTEDFSVLDAILPRIRIELLVAKCDPDPKTGETRAAIRYRGHAQAVAIKVVKGEERCTGGPDLRITVAAEFWDDADETERRAVLFSPLCAVAPQYDPESHMLMLDVYGRPVLRLRFPDILVAGYIESARVCGARSLERRALDDAEQAIQDGGQGRLSFGSMELAHESEVLDGTA